MVYSGVCLRADRPFPTEVLEDTETGGAIEPQYGKRVQVTGPEDSQICMRQFFLLDVLESSPMHPSDSEGKKLPRSFRVMNPAMLCQSLRTREKDLIRSTSLKMIKECGNVALVASGAFKEKHYHRAMAELRKLYGEDVRVTVIDARKEHHWLGDGEPFSQRTLTNHQNLNFHWSNY